MATIRDENNLEGQNQEELQNTDEGQQEESKTYTEEEMQEILQKEADKRVTSALEKAKSKWKKEYEIELEKAKNEAAKLADMTAQEKAEHERDELKKELEQLKAKDTLNEMSKTARGMLVEADINISDELLGVLVTIEAETTKSNVENFVTLFNEAVDKAITERLKAKPPKRGGVAGLTKQDILNIKDPVERINQIQKNKELFN